MSPEFRPCSAKRKHPPLSAVNNNGRDEAGPLLVPDQAYSHRQVRPGLWMMRSTIFDGGFATPAFVTHQLQFGKRLYPKLQILDQPLMTTLQAMGLLKMSGLEATAFLASFVGEIEQSDFISGAIKRYRVEGQRSHKPDVSNT